MCSYLECKGPKQETEDWRHNYGPDARAEDVITMLRERTAYGKENFGESFHGDPLKHLMEELLDALVYSAVEMKKRAEGRNTVITDLAMEAHETSRSKGWWERERPISEMLALAHSEISEALECWRNDDMDIRYEDGKPEGFPIEIADVVVRIFDLCAGLEVPLAEALEIKMAYNKTRPYKHGGKRA